MRSLSILNLVLMAVVLMAPAMMAVAMPARSLSASMVTSLDGPTGGSSDERSLVLVAQVRAVIHHTASSFTASSFTVLSFTV